MSDYVTDWDTIMQDLANGTDDWNTMMPELNDDTFGWSNSVNFDPPAEAQPNNVMPEWNDDTFDGSEFFDFNAAARAQPTASADYDAEGGSEPDIGSVATHHVGPSMIGSPATGYRREDSLNAPTIFQPTNEASYQICGTELLATKNESVPSHDAGLLDFGKTRILGPAQGAGLSAVPQPATETPGDPMSSSESQTRLGASDTDAVLTSGQPCMCIVCLGVGNHIKTKRNTKRLCRILGCFESFASDIGWQYHFNEIEYDSSGLYQHEKSHFLHEGRFICTEDRCSYSTERWPDFTRHTTKHCLSPKTKFPCPELTCQYSGENGFRRKDKMKSHCWTVHERKAKPGKPFQAIKPKIGSAE